MPAATALSPSSTVVGVKSWEHLWHFPSPLGRFSFPSPFPWRIPGARVSVPGRACVSAPRSRSASPFGSVVFGLAGGEKQDLLIPYLLQLPRNLLGLDTACWAVWAGRYPRTPPCSWERWPWRRQNPGAAALLAWEGCWDRDEPGRGCARASIFCICWRKYSKSEEIEF